MPPSKIVKNFELKVKRLPSGERRVIGPLKVRNFATELPELENTPFGSVLDGTITVDAGFVTDFSSVPTPLHWVVGWEQVDVAGVVHDFLYRVDYDRTIADDVWLELARSGETGVGRCRSELCWAVLRGLASWTKKTKPQHHYGWLMFNSALLPLVLVLAMIPVLILTGTLWLVDRGLASLTK